MERPTNWVSDLRGVGPMGCRTEAASPNGDQLCTPSRRFIPLFVGSWPHTDDVLSLNNSKYGDYFDRICPTELEIKETTEIEKSASYLDLHLQINSKGGLGTKLNDKEMTLIFWL